MSEFQRNAQAHARRVLFVLRLFLGLTVWGCADFGVHADERPPVDFQHDIMPVLTKFGCNSGACHGAAIGRGGFKLSLYGGNSAEDYEAIVRQRSGRRVNLASPTRSLLLAKPIESIAHGGGVRFDSESEAAQLLRRWVAEGARAESKIKLRRLEVRPSRYVFPQIDRDVSLQAIAHYTDGSHRDVTKWVVFQPEDESAVSVSDDKATILRKGRHVVVARYLTEVVPIEFVVPVGEAGSRGVPNEANWIDGFIVGKLDEMGLPFAGPCSNSQFLRRVRLDLTGRLPSVEEVEAASLPGWNRRKYVDQLLDSEEFVDYWTFKLAELLRIRPQVNESEGLEVYLGWLRASVEDDKGYDQIARELLLAAGDSHTDGPANFFRTTKTAKEQTEFVSELFMGSRLRCANCHNHPLDRWTQDDYHGLAAILAKVESGRVIRDKADGKVIHPRTKEFAITKLPGAPRAEQPLDRADLADWLLDQDNPFFSQAIVNRLWKHMQGRGLVEPVDDFRATNPATHPELLEALAENFASHGYSLRHTLRLIAHSATYAQRSLAADESTQGAMFYAGAGSRSLRPEVLADAMSDVLGMPEKFGDLPLGTRAVELKDPDTPSMTLDVLGRCDRVLSCESTGSSGGLSQQLHLLNGPLLNQRLGEPGGRLAQLCAAGMSNEQIVEEFYRRAFCRTPTEQELAFWGGALPDAAVDGAGKVPSELEDFVWSILTCREFVTNH